MKIIVSIIHNGEAKTMTRDFPFTYLDYRFRECENKIRDYMNEITHEYIDKRFYQKG